MDTRPRFHLGALTITAAHPRELGRFYSTMLNWPYIREEAPTDPTHGGYALVCAPDGAHQPALNFDYDPNFRRPVWPTAPDQQTPTIHLDIGVDDLEEAVAWAIECGANAADFQPRPDDHRVMFDPEGHPFCLCQS